ncbi:CocE/NonD family hydrolase [Nocardia grenadensis]|uniref:CocE/NonD family hydrolase n=1 Tax=Nocardia grenadensis TaxID=931537 RepID=UPI0007A3C9C5|nr:CocE/NonD family hydrolase [Nocardia grenadensis]
MNPDASWHSDVESPMRDGVVLRGDLWRPARPAPVVIFRTPYGRRKISSDVLRPMDCVESGYAAFVQDTRGRFGSDGAWKPIMWDQEALDTHDTVEWAAAQPWCDGTVILAGTSYGGILSMLGAATRPPHLAGVAAAMVTTGSRDRAEMGGALRLDHLFGWMIYMAADWLARNPEYADADNVALLGSLFADPMAAMRSWPPSANPLARLRGFPLDVEQLLAGAGTTLPEWAPEAIEVPVFVSTGWYDVYASSTIDTFTAGAAAHPEVPYRLVIGPWAHTGPLQHIQGEVNFGVSASAAAIGLPTRQLEFFRRCADTAPVLPSRQVDYFLMGADEWRSDDRWPPREVVSQRFRLICGAAEGRAGGLVSEENRQGEDGIDTYVHDPLSPVPSRGGRLLHLGRLAPGPIDLGRHCARADTLHYLSAPLEQAVDVVGAVSMTVCVSLDRSDTDLFIRLIDRHPDGRLLPVAEGNTRVRFRDDLTTARPLPPGETAVITVDLGNTAQRFAVGHQLGVLVTSSNFPHVDRNFDIAPVTVDPPPVTVSLHTAGSMLTLDILPGERTR